MPNGDGHEPRPTLMDLAKEATQNKAQLEAKVRAQAATIARLSAENEALKTALVTLGVKPPMPPKPTKPRS